MSGKQITNASRRGFLLGIIAAGSAPALVTAASLMKVRQRRLLLPDHFEFANAYPEVSMGALTATGLRDLQDRWMRAVCKEYARRTDALMFSHFTGLRKWP